MIVVAGLCAVIAAAGFLVGGRMTGASGTADTDETVPEEEPEPTFDTIVELEPLNVNLADGHYLRLAVAIGLSDDAEGEESGHGDDPSEETPIETAPASDLVLSTFFGRQMDDLATLEGRERARNDLYDGLVDFYGDGIVAVLFTEFVMQ